MWTGGVGRWEEGSGDRNGGGGQWCGGGGGVVVWLWGGEGEAKIRRKI